MPPFADTTFLCALYRQQFNTDRAMAIMEKTRAVTCSNLVQFEFTQAVRFEIFRHKQDHTKGYSELEGLSVLAQFKIAMDEQMMQIVPIDLEATLARATLLSEKYTIARGSRAFDVLHVASSLT